MEISPSELQTFVTSDNSFVYHAVAASKFIFWDHCITFGQEVDLIWRSERSIINGLFYTIRYLTFVIQFTCLVVKTNSSGFIHPSRTVCVGWLWFDAISGLVIFVCVETVLVIRVFAFYGRSKTLLTFIALLFVAEVAAQVAIVAISVTSIEIIPTPLPLDASARLARNVPSLLPSFGVPGLIFESFLFILVGVRFIRTRMEGGISMPLLIVFVRDGTWAFVLIFATLLWGALTFEITTSMGWVALTWVYSILALCGTRLILNLRDFAAQREAEPAFDVTLELMAAQNPTLGSEPSLVAGTTGPATLATVISAA